MITNTLIHIMNSNGSDLESSYQMIKRVGVEKFCKVLQNPFERTICPEQVIKLLSVFHYMIKNDFISKELFLETNICMITNEANASCIVDIVETDLNPTSSCHTPKWNQTPDISQPNTSCNINNRKEKFNKNSVNSQVILKEVREPLTYLEIIQLYYIYLKRICIHELCEIPLFDCFVIQNMQALGLRILEGQRTSELLFCFELILQDLHRYQVMVIEFMKQINCRQELDQLSEICDQLYINGKQMKFFGATNNIQVDQSELKEFKKTKTSLQSKKFRVLESIDRLEVDDLKNDDIHGFELKQQYNQI